MTLMLDINVLLDVFLVRQPHYLASARILSLIAGGQLHGVLRTGVEHRQLSVNGAKESSAIEASRNY